jgi:hypothetical protein
MDWSSLPNYLAALLVKPFRGPQRSVNIFVRPSNMFCLFTEIYRGHSGSILESVILYSGFKVVSNNYYLSICFHLDSWENGNCISLSENILDIKKE